MTAKKPDFEFSDFISSEVEIETGVAINPKAKLLNFAKIKVTAIDPKIHRKVDEAVQRIEKNLKNLKELVRQ
jgi:hypothetical protein